MSDILDHRCSVEHEKLLPGAEAAPVVPQLQEPEPGGEDERRDKQGHGGEHRVEPAHPPPPGPVHVLLADRVGYEPPEVPDVCEADQAAVPEPLVLLEHQTYGLFPVLGERNFGYHIRFYDKMVLERF